MSNDEEGRVEIPVEKSVWYLVHKRLSDMVSRVIKQTVKDTFNGLFESFGFDVTSRLNETLRHVGFGHQLSNDTIRHEVDVVVYEAMHHFNITDDANATFQHTVVSKLDQEIELDALGQVIMKNTTENWRANDFFHKMPIKDETLFVSMVCMGIIVPIIIFTLFGVYIYKRNQESTQRRNEMLLREQPEFCLEESSPEDHKGNMQEDVADLDFRNSYQA